MINKQSYNFERIRAAVDAAESAQQAGYDEQCADILAKLVIDLGDKTDD